MLSIIPITVKDGILLKDFLSSAGDSLNSFRYFDKRPITVLEQHVCTYLILIEGLPVAYGHLDKEDDIIWLGIAVIEDRQGLGLGKLMMNVLLTGAKLNKISSIQLSVDNNNGPAIQLYQKLGFKIIENKATLSFLKWTL
jgi:GNAT superfamily N-acetyltransferase